MYLLETKLQWMEFGVVNFERNNVIPIRAKDSKFLVQFNQGKPYFRKSAPFNGEIWDINGNAPRFLRCAKIIQTLPAKLRKNKMVMVYFSNNRRMSTRITSGIPIKTHIKNGNMVFDRKIEGIEVYQWVAKGWV